MVRPHHRRRVVVTGVGVASPLGLNAGEFWRNLTAGASGVRRIESLDPAGFDCQIAGQPPEFKINDFVPRHYRKATKVMAADTRLAVVAAAGAFESAGLVSRANDGGEANFNSARFGCNVGAGLISADLDELAYAMDRARRVGDANAVDWRKWGREGMNQLTPLWLLKYLPNMLACHVTILHGLTGPSNNITCAEASGHLSIGEAARAIRRGKADLAVAGGAEAAVNPMAMMRQQLLGRLNATSNDDPASAVRPFDRNAAGTVSADAGALLILEEYEHAAARGATIYCEVAGFGSAQDTHDPTLPDPGGRPYAAAVRAALREAGMPAEEVDLIVPHGLGIAAHDESELSGLRAVFGDDLERPAFAPTKGQLGNPSAGCALDAAAAALAVRHNVAPPAANASDPIAPLNAAAQARPMPIRAALTTAYGLGGQNAALVFKSV